jgi:hypothetical protein
VLLNSCVTDIENRQNERGRHRSMERVMLVVFPLLQIIYGDKIKEDEMD